MKYQNSLIIFLAISFSYICNAQKDDYTNKIAKDSFNDKLRNIEIFTDKSIKKRIFNGEILANTVVFLEQLTNITSDIHEGYDWFHTPSIENYEDWKTWYKLYKRKLYLDGDRVKIKGNPIPVIKNPIKYFKNKLKLVKKSLRKEEHNDPEYSNAVQFLIEITDIVAFCVDPELNMVTPCEKDILHFETWFKKNKNNLYWDVKTHSVKVN